MIVHGLVYHVLVVCTSETILPTQKKRAVPGPRVPSRQPHFHVEKGSCIWFLSFLHRRHKFSQTTFRNLQTTNITTMAGLEWKNLTYTIKAKGIHGTMEERIILDNITGSAKKGQLLAIMGPSGTYE